MRPVHWSRRLHHLYRTSCEDAVRSGDSRYRVCAQLSPSRRHAGDLRSLGSAGVRGRMARRSDILMACRRGALGISHPVHIDRDPANQQAAAQPHIGSALSRSGASAHTMGQAARREERAQWIGFAAFPLLADPSQGYMSVTVRKSLAERR